MNITPNITEGMNPVEKEIYFQHQEMRHAQEREYVDARRRELQDYKQSLIDDVLRAHPQLTRDELAKKTTRTLERMIF